MFVDDLKHSHISISKLYDKGMSILIKYVFYNKSENMLNGIYKRYANIYILNFNDIYLKDVKGLVRWGEDVELWHIGDINMLAWDYCKNSLREI